MKLIFCCYYAIKPTSSYKIHNEIFGNKGHNTYSLISNVSGKIVCMCIYREDGPSWFSSVDRASAYGLKGPKFDSGQGHMPRLQAPSPEGACRRQPINDSLSPLMILSLSPSPSPFLSEINKHI